MNTEKEITLRNCMFIKTVLMMLVILGHASSYWIDNWFIEYSVIQNRELGVLSSWIESLHICGFILVSGYLFTFKILKEIESTLNFC